MKKLISSYFTFSTSAHGKSCPDKSCIMLWYEVVMSLCWGDYSFNATRIKQILWISIS